MMPGKGTISNTTARVSGDRFALAALLAAMLCLPAWNTFAQEAADAAGPGEVAIETGVDRSVITIGDYIDYDVRITAGEGVEIPGSRYHHDLGAFQVIDYQLAGKPKREGKRRVWTDRYVISTYTTGEYEIPPYTLAYRVAGADGEPVEREAKSGPIRIEVKSLSAEESDSADIQPVKPPVSIPAPGVWWIVVLAAFAAAGAGSGVFAYLRFGRKRAVPTGPPPLPPHERAFLELDALRRSDAVLEGNAEEFSMAVSAIIRTYIEGLFGIPALERTSEETVESLENDPAAAPCAAEYAHFFDSCDLVKFGGDLFRWDDFHAVIDEAEELVEGTRPAPETAAIASGEEGAAESRTGEEEEPE